MNLTILPDAALEDAKQIEEIISKIDESMKILDGEIKRIIPEHLETDWSNNLRDRWAQFYDGTVKDSMSAMQESAESLKRAVDAAIAYNK
jgi:hypothetical protein